MERMVEIWNKGIQGVMQHGRGGGGSIERPQGNNAKVEPAAFASTSGSLPDTGEWRPETMAGVGHHTLCEQSEASASS